MLGRNPPCVQRSFPISHLYSQITIYMNKELSNKDFALKQTFQSSLRLEEKFTFKPYSLNHLGLSGSAEIHTTASITD